MRDGLLLPPSQRRTWAKNQKLKAIPSKEASLAAEKAIDKLRKLLASSGIDSDARARMELAHDL
jgi:hypothetical protein